MGIFIAIIFIALMMYIGITYAQMLRENKILREELGESVQKLKNIFICSKNSEHMKKLINANISANLQAGAEVKNKDFKIGMERVEFTNRTEVIVFYEGAKLTPFKKHELNSCTVRVFFDYKLPDSDIRAYIDQLGLRNYIIGFGICDEN